MLVFISWLKHVRMYLTEQKLTNLEAVQLIKDHMTENARGVVKPYLNTNCICDYEELIGHLRTYFESCKTFSSFIGDFYSRVQ